MLRACKGTGVALAVSLHRQKVQTQIPVQITVQIHTVFMRKSCFQSQGTAPRANPQLFTSHHPLRAIAPSSCYHYSHQIVLWTLKSRLDERTLVSTEYRVLPLFTSNRPLDHYHYSHQIVLWTLKARLCCPASHTQLPVPGTGTDGSMRSSS